MSEPRFIYSIFCDDIRQEVGNKFSLMGVYGPLLFVPHIPIVLPRLCVVMRARTPVENPFKQLKFKILRNDELANEVEISEDTLIESAQAAIESAKASPPTPPYENPFLEISVTAQLVPLVVNEPFRFRIRVITELGELKGGSLSISQQPASN